MTNTTKIKKPFESEYKYELRQEFNIYYGAYSQNRNDISQGLIGDIGPFFYANNYYKNIDKYWMGCYFHQDLLKNDWSKLEFIFDEYANIASVKDQLGGKDGKIKGDEASYTGKSGLRVGSLTYIEVPANITASVVGYRNLCYYFAFSFEEPLSNDYRLLGRGPPDSPHSIEIYMNKRNGYRTISLKVGFVTLDGSPKTITFDDDRKVKPTFNELEVCASFAVDNIASALIFLNGEVKFKEIVTGFGVNLDVYGDKHEILDKDKTHKGSFTIILFNIIEGGGGAILSQEDHPQVIFFVILDDEKMPEKMQVTFE